MARKNIVVEIMEKRTASYGFQYKEYTYNAWIFTRQVEEVSQNITILKNPHDQAYSLILDVNEAGYCDMRDITDNPEYKDQWISYTTEEERIMVLNKLGDFLDKYGINKLNELVQWEKTRVKPIKPTIEMSKRLCEEHTELTLQFIQRNHAEDLSEEEILQLVKQELVELRGKDYEDVQEKLLELAAVYGDMFIKKVGGCFNYLNEIPYVSIPEDPAICVFRDIVTAWQKNEENSIIEYYNRTCERNIKVIKAWRKTDGDDWQKKHPTLKRCGYKIPIY